VDAVREVNTSALCPGPWPDCGDLFATASRGPANVGGSRLETRWPISDASL